MLQKPVSLFCLHRLEPLKRVTLKKYEYSLLYHNTHFYTYNTPVCDEQRRAREARLRADRVRRCDGCALGGTATVLLAAH